MKTVRLFWIKAIGKLKDVFEVTDQATLMIFLDDAKRVMSILIEEMNFVCNVYDTDPHCLKESRLI